MNEYEKAAQTNLKVWARRFDVKPDSDKATEFLNREFRGSVLRGPCTYTMCMYLKKNKIVPTHCIRSAGFIAVELLVSALRNELVGDNLTTSGAIIAARRRDDNIWLQHSRALVGAVVFALKRREIEKNSFGAHIQQRMRDIREGKE